MLKTKLVQLLLLLMILAIYSSCSNAPVETRPEIKPAPTITNNYKFKWNNPEWTGYLVDALKSSKIIKMAPLDRDTFNYNNQDPIIFWGNILVEMAKWESNFNPASKYHEPMGMYSRGLFQVSLVDAKRYGCGFTTEKSVHNVKLNIECAVMISDKLIGQNNRIAGKRSRKWQGNSRYWSVLRGTRDYTKKALNAIKQANK